MPLHRFKCSSCKASAEELYSQSEEVPEAVPCPFCSGTLKRQIPLVARTEGRWGDQMGKHGVNGFYDRGLGRRYYNSLERDRICREQGKIPLSDMGDGWWEARTAEQVAEKRRDEAMLSTYLGKVREYGGDTVRAMSETMPAKDCLAGKYD
mgnify:CR=1 FL=1|jgi:putative FmdB family regulatory protein